MGKVGAKYKARDMRKIPRGHCGLVTLMARVSSVVIKEPKLVVSKTSRKTKG